MIFSSKSLAVLPKNEVSNLDSSFIIQNDKHPDIQSPKQTIVKRILPTLLIVRDVNPAIRFLLVSLDDI